MENNVLTGVKAQKFGIFYPFFGDSTESFVRLCSGRGENAWSKVLDKVHYLDTLEDDKIKQMANDLYSKFTLDVEVSITDVIKIVGQSAREHGVKPNQDAKWYLDWVSSLFLVEKVKQQMTTIALKPIFKLMPNQN
jgi:uncharacterized UBP type Zn finger protein